jgi:hypothetical protein
VIPFFASSNSLGANPLVQAKINPKPTSTPVDRHKINPKPTSTPVHKQTQNQPKTNLNTSTQNQHTNRQNQPEVMIYLTPLTTTTPEERSVENHPVHRKSTQDWQAQPPNQVLRC